jgi:Flp pilus assembly pilin Flp
MIDRNIRGWVWALRLARLARRARQGVTALEYGLISALIGGVIVTAVTSYSGAITAAYLVIGNTMEAGAAGL